MKDEITLLREENKRLNTIIYVLTEKLQETETSLYAYLKNNIGINDVADGIPKNIIGINETIYAYDKNKIGTNDAADGIPKNEIGINETIYAYDKNRIGTNDVIYGTTENILGTRTINLVVLAGKLKAFMNNCPESALSNTAKTLAHLYANPKCQQKDLMKITKLSLGGIAKHFKALKTRNLIVKDASGHYVLSDAAIKLLEAARG